MLGHSMRYARPLPSIWEIPRRTWMAIESSRSLKPTAVTVYTLVMALYVVSLDGALFLPD